MKNKIIITLFLTLAGFFVMNAFSASATAKTASSSDTTQDLDQILSDKNSSSSTLDKLKQIRDLKEKIATKVTQIRQNSQGALYGQVKEVSTASITLVNLKEEHQIILNSDVNFYSLVDTERKESSLSKITKGMFVSVFGIFDEGKKNLDPKFIYIQKFPVRIIGKIVDIDKASFAITVKENQITTIVDIEKYTKTFKFNPSTDKWSQIGFSKLSVGDFIHIIAISDEKSEERVHAQKIYSLSLLTPAISPTEATESSPSSIPK
ncbi:hypothetical protein HY338_00770 [Candidatus Gottesmanbacteria bacterium]|nr:hypothetical protein [Candidatus Gottesmanbacteria bacterium]